MLNRQDYPKIDQKTIDHFLVIDDNENANIMWEKTVNNWLKELSKKLDHEYHIVNSERAILLTPENKRFTNNFLSFVEKTLTNIFKILNGIVQDLEYGKYIFIILDSDDTYYDYVSSYHPNEIENIPRTGLYIFNNSFGHFVFPKQELTITEPVLVHELTRVCINKLQLPTWLDEGLATTLENELTGFSSVSINNDTLERHKSFWNLDNIQLFWSGELFYESGESSQFCRELAQIIIQLLLKNYDYEVFRNFVINAQYEDAGEQSANTNLDISLGDIVSAFLKD